MATISEVSITLVGIAITVKANFFLKKNSDSVFSKDKSELPEVTLFLVVTSFRRLCSPSCPGRGMVLHRHLDILSQTKHVHSDSMACMCGK